MRKGFMVCVLFWLFSSVAFGSEITGRVVGISDGDTLTLLTADKQQVKVRLSSIDTPEKAQPYGQKARQALADLTFQKNALLKVEERDRYGRTVARVFVGELDVNRELVAMGAAWVYRQYNRDPALLQVEADAKAAKLGLWALSEAERVPPWEWRRAGNKISEQRPTAELLSQGGNAGQYSCSPRKTCGQMSSCVEARYHLATCGNKRLDRDNDGIPCESLCK